MQTYFDATVYFVTLCSAVINARDNVPTRWSNQVVARDDPMASRFLRSLHENGTYNSRKYLDEQKLKCVSLHKCSSQLKTMEVIEFIKHRSYR